MMPFANPVFPMVREVRIEKDPVVITEMLNSGNWVAINGVNEQGQMKLMLGRINPAWEIPEELAHKLLHEDCDHQPSSK